MDVTAFDSVLALFCPSVLNTWHNSIDGKNCIKHHTSTHAYTLSPKAKE